MNDNPFDILLKQKLINQKANSASDWSVFKAKLDASMRPDALFDDAIKNTLSTHVTNRQPDWNQFKAKLDKTKNDDHFFDKNIKAALSGFTVAGMSDWTTFKEKLDQALLEDPSFDNIIREKISNQGKVGTADWNTFAKKLNDNIDTEFDKKVASKLNLHSKSLVSEHWVMLQKRLIEISTIRKQITNFKLMEAGLVIALLFSVWNFYPYIINALDNNTSTVVEKAIATNYTNSNEPIDKINLAVTANNSEIKSFGESQEKAENQSNDTKQKVEKKKKVSTQNFFVDHQKDGHQNTSLTSNKTNLLAGLNEMTPPNYDKTTEKQLAQSNRLISIQKLSIINNPIEAFEVSTPKLILDVLPIGIDQKEKKNNSKWLHSMAIEYGYHLQQIQSPFDDIYKVEAYAHYAQNNSFGLLLNINIKPVILEVGVHHSALNYTPYKNVEYWDNLDEEIYREYSLIDINYNLLRIPMQVKFQKPMSQKWSYFGSFGTSLNTIIQSDYSIEIVEFEKEQEESQKLLSPALFFKPFSNGLLMDRSWKHNFHIDLSTEIGVERKLGKHFGVYAKLGAAYQVIGDGLGPNRDRFNRLSSAIGLKHYF